VHPNGARIEDLPAGARIGTSAVRRVAQLALHWPHLTAAPIRGNANTRLAKLDAGEYDAVLLGASTAKPSSTSTNGPPTPSPSAPASPPHCCAREPATSSADRSWCRRRREGTRFVQDVVAVTRRQSSEHVRRRPRALESRPF
jgi:hypothetical protein